MNSKYSGAQVEAFLDFIHSLTNVTSVTEYRSLKSSFSSGYFNLAPATQGSILNATTVNEGSWRRLKIAVSKGDKFKLTGKGGGGIKNVQEERSEDLTSSVSKGYYTYSSTTVGTSATATKASDGGWRRIERSVVEGEKYVITGTGGGGARLYCLMNSSGIIKAIAGSGEVQSGLELTIEENGTLYCSFNNSFTYSLIRKYSETVQTSFNARLFCITDTNGTITKISDADKILSEADIFIGQPGYLYVNCDTSNQYELLQAINI